jgi:HxlR-like helix-turn-helix
MPAEPTVFQCPVDAQIHILGGKWKLVLVFYLLQSPRRNGELRRLVPAIRPEGAHPAAPGTGTGVVADHSTAQRSAAVLAEQLGPLGER